jgi:EAL domain-containing protein (putative c-di-GMP-specific phosphodiesterase class I)
VFIDLAEETGAIIGIGAWVLETATRQLQLWKRRYGLPHLSMSVNASACQILIPPPSSSRSTAPSYQDPTSDCAQRSTP